MDPMKKTQPTFLNNLLYEKLRSLAPHPVTLNKRSDHFPDQHVEVIHAEKPNFSYKELIMISIFCDFNRQMCLNDIYLTIKRWFPYYQQKSVGVTWQNSIRHNLSLNRCFKRLSPNDLGSHRHSTTKVPSRFLRHNVYFITRSLSGTWHIVIGTCHFHFAYYHYF